MLDQFDKLRKKNAFLEQYKKERMFENSLDEFDDARLHFRSSLPFNCCAHKDSRATCEELMKEYKACESPDYITYVSTRFYSALTHLEPPELHRAPRMATNLHNVADISVA